MAVIGPNGAGKTTLLSILAGVQAPSAGTVNRGAGEGSWVGTSDSPRSTRSCRCVENLRLFARLEKVADPEAAVARMLDQTGLAERADERSIVSPAATASASTSRSGCSPTRP